MGSCQCKTVVFEHSCERMIWRLKPHALCSFWCLLQDRVPFVLWEVKMAGAQLEGGCFSEQNGLNYEGWTNERDD